MTARQQLCRREYVANRKQTRTNIVLQRRRESGAEKLESLKFTLRLTRHGAVTPEEVAMQSC